MIYLSPINLAITNAAYRNKTVTISSADLVGSGALSPAEIAMMNIIKRDFSVSIYITDAALVTKLTGKPVTVTLSIA